MKNLFLLFVSILILTPLNAQVKTNKIHSKQIKKSIKSISQKNFDNSKIRKIDSWEIINKNFILKGSDNKNYTYDGDSRIVKNFFENSKNEPQLKIGCPPGFTPTSGGGCFKFQKIETCKSSTVSTDDDGNVCMMLHLNNGNYLRIFDVTDNINERDLTNFITVRQNGKNFITEKTRILKELINNSKELSKNNSQCPKGSDCYYDSNTGTSFVITKDLIPNLNKKEPIKVSNKKSI